MTSNNNYTTLYKTSKLEVKHLYEDVYLTGSGKDIFLGRMYGDPICAVIDSDNRWCVVGGERLIVWVDNKVIKINDEGLANVHSIRQVDENSVELLIDPWSVNPAVWSFNVVTGAKQRQRDFNHYKDKPYTEAIEW